MSGTFSSFTSALSALRYNRAAMDVASGNVANAGTDGYTRRRVVGESVGAPAVSALWSRFDGAADGVDVASVDRMSDPFLNARARTQHGEQSVADVRSTVLSRVESGLGEPGGDGVAAALSSFYQGWHDVANGPGDGAARSQILGRAQTLATSLATQSRNVGTEWSDQRSRLDGLVTEVNSAAADLADLNRSIQVATVSGADTGDLADKRDQLTMRLAELAGATTTSGTNGTVEVRIGGAVLVSGTTADQLAATGAGDLAGATADPVRFTLGGTDLPPGTLSGGSIAGTTGLLNSTLPGYVADLDAVASEVAGAVNAQHRAGYDANGDAGGDFFTGTTAATLAVAITDPDRVAAAGGGAPGTLDGTNADALAGLGAGTASYRQLVTDLGTQVASANRAATNQQVLTDQIDGAREALSGVSLDEEMVTMVARQRAYEGASRVMTTLDSVLDTLINRTGLVR